MRAWTTSQRSMPVAVAEEGSGPRSTVVGTLELHILDDPCVSPRVRRLLDAHARRYCEPMDSDRVRELARVERATGPDRPTSAAVEFIVGFEQRYGGLWYRAFGDNGIEYGLEGGTTLYETDLGIALPAILDGDTTARMYLLPDGRTTVWTGRGNPSMVIDSSLQQRIENHALVAESRSWPHQVFSLTCALHAGPGLLADQLPPPVPEASGPANLWLRSQLRSAGLTSFPRNGSSLPRALASSPNASANLSGRNRSGGPDDLHPRTAAHGRHEHPGRNSRQLPDDDFKMAHAQ